MQGKKNYEVIPVKNNVPWQHIKQKEVKPWQFIIVVLNGNKQSGAWQKTFPSRDNSCYSHATSLHEFQVILDTVM